jgi:hypothetical protein
VVNFKQAKKVRNGPAHDEAPSAANAYPNQGPGPETSFLAIAKSCPLYFKDFAGRTEMERK